jgi:hypothetical protein
MKLTQLEKAKKLHGRLLELDVEILEMEKVAELIANKKTEIKISLKVDDVETVEKEKNKVRIDADDSLDFGQSDFRKSMYSMWMPFGGSCSDKPKKKEWTLKQDYTVPDNVALQVLGVLMAEKMHARELAIKALNKLGVTV